MKLSLSIGSKTLSLGFGTEQKSLSPLQQAFLTGSDAPNTNGAALQTPYAQSAWIYTCIQVLAENLAGIPFRISKMPTRQAAMRWRAQRSSADPKHRTWCRRTADNQIVEDGPLVELFECPHPTQDRALFWETLMTYRALRGEFFVVPLDMLDNPIDLRAGQMPSRMLTLEPQMFWHNVQGYTLNGWRYTGSPLMAPLPSEYLTPTEVIHSRAVNPYLYWRGMSPLLVALLPAQSDYAIEQFVKGMMLNNADTGLIVTSEQQVNEDQQIAIKAALRERKRMAGTADRPLFLWGGMKVEKPSLSLADQEVLETRKLNRQQIAAIYKVPQVMLGFGDNKGLGNGTGLEQERYTFFESTMAPLCAKIEAALDPILKAFGPEYVGWFDIDSLPVMQEARRLRYDAAIKVFNMGVPFNEINEKLDLGYEELPWGDTGYLPFSLTPAGSQSEPIDAVPVEEEDTATPIADAEKLFRKLLAPPPTTKAHVCAANPAFEASIKGSEKAKIGRMKKFFFEQRGRVLRALDGIDKSLFDSPEWERRALDDIFDLAKENERLLRGLNPLLTMDLNFGGQQILHELNLSEQFVIPPTDAIKFLAKRKKEIEGINETTFAKLKDSLREGLAGGESFADLADRVKAVYDNASQARAEMIALTETNIAVNTGRHESMKAVGVERKGWNTSHLENTRATHWRNEEITVAQNGIPIDDEWPNGLQHPGDPAGAPGEVINCRCHGGAIMNGKSINPPKLLSFEEFTARFAQKPASDARSAAGEANTPAKGGND